MIAGDDFGAGLACGCETVLLFSTGLLVALKRGRSGAFSDATSSRHIPFSASHTQSFMGLSIGLLNRPFTSWIGVCSGAIKRALDSPVGVELAWFIERLPMPIGTRVPERLPMLIGTRAPFNSSCRCPFFERPKSFSCLTTVGEALIALVVVLTEVSDIHTPLIESQVCPCFGRPIGLAAEGGDLGGLKAFVVSVVSRSATQIPLVESHEWPFFGRP